MTPVRSFSPAVEDYLKVLEHAVSPGLCEVIAARLGDPQIDPHGDPIPTRDGHLLGPAVTAAIRVVVSR